MFRPGGEREREILSKKWGDGSSFYKQDTDDQLHVHTQNLLLGVRTPTKWLNKFLRPSTKAILHFKFSNKYTSLLLFLRFLLRHKNLGEILNKEREKLSRIWFIYPSYWQWKEMNLLFPILQKPEKDFQYLSTETMKIFGPLHVCLVET